MPHGQGDAQGATERPLAEFRALSRAQQQKRVIQEFSELQHLDQVPNDAIDTMFLTALTPAHRDKNRYCDVLANEATIYPPPSTDLYINGNLIRGERFGTTLSFVACQAPLPAHIDEFWKVVAASKTPLIVNLTGLVEAGRVKSHAYWPSKVGETKRFGGSSVTLLHEDPAEGGLVQHTSVKKLRHEPSGHEVLLAHFEGWPDMGVPDDAVGVRSIIDFLEQLPNPADAPVFVHCSAGIGRTGTLIAAYTARQLLRRGALEDNSIRRIVAELKRTRCGMVQRREQLGFVYRCALEDIAELGAPALKAKVSRSETDGEAEA